MFALQNAPGSALALEGVQVSRMSLEGHSAKFDLSMSARELAEGLHTRWEFNTDLFDAQTIERMAGHFHTLLEGIVADAQRRIGALPLLTEAERHQLLVEWNDTALDYPQDRCIHELFEAQVARSPEAVAVVFEDQQLTYGELNARANRLAHHLIGLGVGPEVLVGICMERSLELVIGLLGILKAGGAYVALDRHYPQERLRFILEDTGLKVLLTHRSLDGQFPAHRCEVVDVGAPLSHVRSDDPARSSSPRHLAYLIYTSGSTGTPKGVAIEHHSTVAFLYWVREAFTDEELSGVLGVTSICFDLSVFELFGSLCWGGKVILVDNALDLRTCRHRQQVKLLNTVPSVMQTLLDSQALPASVVTVNLAGEPLRRPLVDALYACAACAGGSTTLMALPKRTTTYSTWTLPRPGHLATIGRPIANTQIYLLDPSLNPMPVGTTGELWIGGAGVARGYWQRSELTAERFVPDPHVRASGRGCIAPGILHATCRMAILSFWGARTLKSSCAAFASSSVRSRRCWRALRGASGRGGPSAKMAKGEMLAGRSRAGSWSHQGLSTRSAGARSCLRASARTAAAPRRMWCSSACRSPPTARSIAALCSHLSAIGRKVAARTWHPPQFALGRVRWPNAQDRRRARR